MPTPPPFVDRVTGEPLTGDSLYIAKIEFIKKLLTEAQRALHHKNMQVAYDGNISAEFTTEQKNQINQDVVALVTWVKDYLGQHV